MEVHTNTPKALFQSDIRYIIPQFQRPYVWNQEHQWEPLWNDIRNTAETYLDYLSSGMSPQEAEAGTGTHFMGAIVLKQRSTPTAAIEEREVIDGQQRLTTLQILLDAAQEVFERLEFPKPAEAISRLVLNNYSEGDEVFKLWPSSLDQSAFRAVMTNGEDTADFEGTPIVQAHEFFQLQIEEWIKRPDASGNPENHVHGLQTALMGLLAVVTIDLGVGDDPYVIFETLNARGTPLLASDLVKNMVMHTSEGAGLNPATIHSQYWKGFERSYWRKEVSLGRVHRPKIDVLLDYWLEMRTHKEVASQDVFRRFRLHLLEDCEGDIEGVLGHLNQIAATWESMDRYEKGTREEQFVYRWRGVEAGAVTPLVLFLFSEMSAGNLTESDLHEALSAVESFLVRRMICRMTTKNYNRLFTELLKKVDEGEHARAPATICDFLGKQEADASLWPEDHDVQQAISVLPLYRLLTRGRLRLVLEAIEDSMRTPHSEDDSVRRKLTIEHVMPRKWGMHWAPPLGEDSDQAFRDREREIHTLGNLTLVTSSLNPSMSNGPWESKRTALHEHTNLLMTRNLIDEAGSDWTDASIRARSKSMGEMVCRIWEKPA